jgi:hypothetical protein
MKKKVGWRFSIATILNLEALVKDGRCGTTQTEVIERLINDAVSKRLDAAIVGWRHPVTAKTVLDCVFCDEPIKQGDPYLAADTVGNVGGVYGHPACVEKDIAD